MKVTGENRSTRRKTCPSVTLSTTNPTWTDSLSNPVLRGEFFGLLVLIFSARYMWLFFSLYLCFRLKCSTKEVKVSDDKLKCVLYNDLWSAVLWTKFFIWLFIYFSPCFFLSFLLWPLYLPVVGVQGYCWTWSQWHTHTHSVGLLWTRDPYIAESSTWQHTTLIWDIHQCHRRDFFFLPVRGFSPLIHFCTVLNPFVLHVTLRPILPSLQQTQHKHPCPRWDFFLSVRVFPLWSIFLYCIKSFSSFMSLMFHTTV
jgi:hypothetical protein